jgi:hypothetical protein
MPTTLDEAAKMPEQKLVEIIRESKLGAIDDANDFGDTSARSQLRMVNPCSAGSKLFTAIVATRE